MSLIIGWIDSASSTNKFGMIADKGVFFANEGYKVTDREPKIINIDNNYIVGAVGNAGWCEEVIYILKNSNVDLADRHDVRDFLKTAKQLEDWQDEPDSEIMIIGKDNIIVARPDSYIFEPDTFWWAIGAGADFSLGFLDGFEAASGFEKENISTAMVKCIEFCSKYSLFVAGIDEGYDIIELGADK